MDGAPDLLAGVDNTDRPTRSTDANAVVRGGFYCPGGGDGVDEL